LHDARHEKKAAVFLKVSKPFTVLCASVHMGGSTNSQVNKNINGDDFFRKYGLALEVCGQKLRNAFALGQKSY